MNPVLINVVLFYVGWFACIWGAATQHPFLGPLVMLLVLGVHLFLIPNAAREVRLLAIAGLLGFSLDTAQAALGAFAFHGTGMSTWVSPLWMVVLWLNFATTLHTSLNWLTGRYLLAAILGVIGGPLSYYAGAQLGALSLHPNITLSMLTVAVAWGGAMPFLVWLAHRPDMRS